MTILCKQYNFLSESSNMVTLKMPGKTFFPILIDPESKSERVN